MKFIVILLFFSSAIIVVLLWSRNKFLQSKNAELYKNLQDFYFEIIQTFARIVDAKDAYTANHSSRVRNYSKMIAEKIGFSVEMTKQIEYAALMHDIGKIGISENILKRDGALSQEETEVMKSHPIIGYNIIAPMSFLSELAPIVLYHHERYDGSGYPEKLSKDNIPLGARIISIADSYDAMTSDRPYRKALTKEESISELVRKSGTQFDPKIVEIFIEILKEDIVL
jgi:putative nucleotidyltransferase with HDIG domain